MITLYYIGTQMYNLEFSTLIRELNMVDFSIYFYKIVMNPQLQGKQVDGFCADSKAYLTSLL